MKLCYKLGVLQSEITLKKKDIIVLVGCKMSMSHQPSRVLTKPNVL